MRNCNGSRKLMVLFMLTLIVASMTACKKEEELEPEAPPAEEVEVDPFMEFVNSVDADTCNFSGMSGDGIDWYFKDNVLIIKGTGNIENITTVNDSGILVPDWMDNSSIVLTCKTVYMEEGIQNIPDYAFCGMEKLTKVIIPYTVTSIGNFSFAYCNVLKSLELPDGITSIGDRAFYESPEFETIKGGNRLVSIGAEAFRSTSLKDISLDNISSMSSDSFLDTPFLENKIAELKEHDGIWSMGSLFYMYVDGSLEGSDSIEIPEYIITIADNAFANTNIKSVKFGRNTAIVGNRAFYSCQNLEELDLGIALTSVGDEAFSNCKLLESVVIPDTVKEIGIKAFKGCSNLVSVDYGEGLNSIPSETFSLCEKLETIDIPYSITDVAEDAFMRTAYEKNKATETNAPVDNTETSEAVANSNEQETKQ